MKDSASSTALLVSRGVCLAASEPRLTHFVPPDIATQTRAILFRAGKRANKFVNLTRKGWFRWIAFRIEHFLLPGIFLHYALRKRWIQQQVEAQLADSAGTVVVLGAGFDTLSLRILDSCPLAQVFEVDHPATQRDKVELMKRLSDNHQPNVISSDLFSQEAVANLFDQLQADAEGDAVFVAEGLLMYVPKETVEELFRRIARRTGRQTFVFTAMGFTASGQPGFTGANELVSRWLAQKREPFFWGIQPKDVPSWLTSLGFNLLDSTNPNILRNQFQVPMTEPIPEGEYLYVAVPRQFSSSSGKPISTMR